MSWREATILAMMASFGTALGISCTSAEQKKAETAIDQAGKTLDQVCAERATLKDAGAD